MAGLADDLAAAVPFVATYGDHLAHVVRRHLFDLGRPDLARDADEVAGLVWDAVLVLHDNAGSWDPAGALPWTWAWRPLRSCVAAAIGHARADVEPDALALEAPAMGAAAEPDLEALALVHRELQLLFEALGEVPATEVQRQVHLEYRIQKAYGDPSPARTVAAQFGLTEANVRQIDRRVRVKLTTLVASDARFTPLRVIPWLDAELLDASGRDEVASESAPG